MIELINPVTAGDRAKFPDYQPFFINKIMIY